ncbi:MAG: hypothetical protein PHD30_09260 [Paludibacter sp.]|nr:hypothetical protein [Paludibacter sp.]
MKTIISIIILLVCMVTYLPAQDVIDDVYFKPSDANKALTTEKIKSAKPNYKNGAKEIIYIDNNKKNKSLIIDKDTVYLLSEINDSIAMAEGNDSIVEDGYYLNEFQGGNTEYEYAERIRRFHNPKFTIHISDPQYTDIYFLDDNYWNVYVDGSYAWVTPTWTNPFWDNYFWRPYSYSSWYWRNSWFGSPYTYYNSWYYDYPWNYGYYSGYYGGYYGGWGNYYYPGYYGGWGYPYHYGHHWNNYPHWGYTTTSRNQNYNEANRRREYYSGARSGSGSGRSSVNTRIAGGNYNPAVGRGSVVTSERQRIAGESGRIINRSVDSRSAIRSTINRTTNTIRNTGIDTRTRTINNSSLYNRDSRTTTSINRNNNAVSRSSSDAVINSNTRGTRTSPATTINRSSSTVRTGTGTSTIRSTNTPSRSESYSSPAVRSSSPSRSQSYSTPSYSSPSTTTRSSSGSSYSGSSSGSSRSSGSSYSGSSSGGSRNSGSSSGGRR